MLHRALVYTVVTLAAAPMPTALRAEDTPRDAAEIAHLAEKAAHADVRERPYLYAHLVRADSDLAEHDIQAGDADGMAEALRSIKTYAAALEASLDPKTKKLQSAEILLRESAFALRSALKAAPIDDRPALAEAIKEVDDAEARVMAAVFQR